MEIEFIPLDYDYFDFEGRSYLKVIGRDGKGNRVCVIDKFEPYFWAILDEGVKSERIKEIREQIEGIRIESKGRITNVLKTEVEDKNLLGKSAKAIKIFISNYKDGHSVADEIDFQEIVARREYDLSLITKYIMQRKMLPLQWHTITGEKIEEGQFEGFLDKLEVELIINAEKIQKSSEKEFKPKILAYDIETDEFEIGKGEIVMISLYGENFKKVLAWKKCTEKQDYVECFKSEKEMLKKFVEYVKTESADILVGYFSDGFDLPYLRERARENGIKLSLGLDGSSPTFSRGKIASGSIAGIVHVDLYRFIETVFSQYLQSETLGLNEVALELIGEGKKEHEFKHSKKIKENEWEEYFEYNLQDSILTYKLAQKFWPDMLEFSRILQEPLFEITRDGMSQLVENYIIHNLEKFNEVCQKRPIHDEIQSRMTREKYEGAFVFQPIPALYENLVMFDFTSYLPSIIVSFNLSASTLLAKKEKDALEVNVGERKFYFSKEKGFFPQMLEEIINLRKKYKKEYSEEKNPIKLARSNAYKLLANASYGYQGFFGARYYCPEASASTTALSQEFIKSMIEKTNREDFKVVYADTDSFCCLLNKHNKEEALEFLKKLNKDLPGIMEIDLEDFYKRGIWVSKKSGEAGAKKKYALIDHKGKIKIRGFETVRRDWCTLARNLQSYILKKVLEEGNEKSSLEYFNKIVKDLKERKIDRKEIMIRTQLKKPISEYKSISPHVIAAQKMKDAGEPVDVGMLVEYFIAETRETKKLVREKVKLPDETGEYNIKYYLEHQIIPAVENIFEVFGISVKEESSGKKQMKLF